MITLTVYNHKGGVGKTTITVNVAAAMARQGKRVLLIDTDPQCNLTAYLLSDDLVNDLLDNSDSPTGGTVWTAVRPVFNGDGRPVPVSPTKTVVDDMLLVPGDIRLSEYEQFLGDQWTDSFKRRLGALRATASLSTLARTLGELHEIDYVFYDTGPNIGPLNRVLLLDSDFFIVPVACDLFSERALGTLGQTIAGWITDWGTISALAPDAEAYLAGRPKFMGYVPQQFKEYGQKMAVTPSLNLRRIQRRIQSDVVNVLRKVDESLAPWTGNDLKLGEVKEFGQIVELAQRQGLPLCDVQGGNQTHAEEAWEVFDEIADQVIQRSAAPARKRVIKKRGRK